jgi:hypothetical protein
MIESYDYYLLFFTCWHVSMLFADLHQSPYFRRRSQISFAAMLYGKLAVSALFLLAASARVSSADAFQRPFVRTISSTHLYSTKDKQAISKIVPPREVSGADAAELFEEHVQKTYG